MVALLFGSGAAPPGPLTRDVERRCGDSTASREKLAKIRLAGPSRSIARRSRRDPPPPPGVRRPSVASPAPEDAGDHEVGRATAPAAAVTGIDRFRVGVVSPNGADCVGSASPEPTDAPEDTYARDHPASLRSARGAG